MRIIKFFFRLLIYIAIIAGLEFGLSMTLYNPVVIVPAYSWVRSIGFFKDTPKTVNDLYPVFSMDKINRSLVWRPRGSVIGKVTEKVKADDGDWHINVRDSSGDVLVVEFTPDYKTALPDIGSEIKVWGILRYDMEHRWWEIHPAAGWEKVKK
ncbi:MAG: hypothetical protein KGJ58_04155 [Patescibacteria group bacterium]|nr:hypothetical protein [Patescibacteria group bacterium]MDE1988551.1 hypothetical protein [Patescibacteria group bacterium]MDE2218612.1 hypothetical protein [Patescibacteria group bacterium]